MATRTRARRSSRSPHIPHSKGPSQFHKGCNHHELNSQNESPAQTTNRKHPYLSKQKASSSTKRRASPKYKLEDSSMQPKQGTAGRSPLGGLSPSKINAGSRDSSPYQPEKKAVSKKHLRIHSSHVHMRHGTPNTKMQRKERELASLKKKAIVNKRKTVFDESLRDFSLEGSFLSTALPPKEEPLSNTTVNSSAISICTVNSSNPGDDEDTSMLNQTTATSTSRTVEIQCSPLKANAEHSDAQCSPMQTKEETCHDMQCSPMKFETSTATQCSPAAKLDVPTMITTGEQTALQGEVTLRDANCSPLKWDLEVSEQSSPELTAVELDSMQQDMDKAAFTRFLQKRMSKNKELIRSMELQLTHLMSYERLDELAIARLVEDIEARSRENEHLEAQLAWVQQEDTDKAESIMFPNLKEYTQNTSEVNQSEDLLATPVGARNLNFSGLDELKNATSRIHATNMSILQYQNECSMLHQRLTDEEQRRAELETSLFKMSKITDAAIIVKKQELTQTRHALLLSEIMKASNDLLDQKLDQELEQARLAKLKVLNPIPEESGTSNAIVDESENVDEGDESTIINIQPQHIPIKPATYDESFMDSEEPLFNKTDRRPQRNILPEHIGQATYVASPGVSARTAKLSLGLASLPSNNKKSKKLARKIFKKMGWKKRSATLPAY